MSKIKVGVVGVGYLGQFHAEKYARIKGVDLVGVVDIIPSRAREIAKRTHSQPFFHHSELFHRVQAVSIAVPTPLHYAISKDFIIHGIDVLLEKPISKTLEEADELIELAQLNNTILQIGHLERFNGVLSGVERAIKNPKWIDSQRIGPFSGRETDVDVVIDLMVHDLDIILKFINSKPKQIQAVGLPVVTPHLDIAHARIEFENGCIANLTASRVSREKIRKTLIFQSNGMLCLDYLSQKAFFSGRGKNRKWTKREIPVKKVDPLEIEIRSFIKSVKERREAKVSGKDGRKALEIALQIIKRIKLNFG